MFGRDLRSLIMKNLIKCFLLVSVIFTGCKTNSGDIEMRNAVEEHDPFDTVAIGGQIWMKYNLDLNTFRNGDIIHHVSNREEWKIAGESGQPAWCYYPSDTMDYEKFGKLYNWYAVSDTRGLAPQGWRIPSNYDWLELIAFAGGEEEGGIGLKYFGEGGNSKEDQGREVQHGGAYYTTHYSGAGNGTNETGFTGLPGGERVELGGFMNYNTGLWWSSTETDSAHASSIELHYWAGEVKLEDRYGSKAYGFSVRCLRD